MPVGHWSGGDAGSENWETWDEPCVVSRNVSPEAFMEELCASAGGYNSFFWTLIWHYLGWWAAVVIVPTVFLDHHKCEAQLDFLSWLVYAGTVFAMLAMAVLLELSVVQRLGLLKAGELSEMFSERRWQVPLVSTILWKLSTYMDVAFMFIARDCGSSLWWASLATFVFGVVLGQLLINTCFACNDCSHELPRSFGFVLLDFKMVNTAIRDVLPFDPDANDLPIAKPVTLRTTGHLVGMEKVVSDIAQVSIQIAFLHNQKAPQTFVIFSILVGMIHGTLAFIQVIRECVQDEWDVQNRGVQMGAALMPTAVLMDHGSFSTTSTPTQMKQMSNLGDTGRAHDNSRDGRDSHHSSKEQSSSRLPSLPAVQIGRSIEIPDLL